MDRDFWQSVVDSDAELPAGYTAQQLTPELILYLGSTDPFLRDEVAFETLATWIEREGVYTHDELRAIARQMAHNLTLDIGEQSADSVFLRSFSALVLDCVIDYDNAHPFLEAAEVRQFLDAALNYLVGERDLRGYVPEKGWAHSVAHTADLLAFLGQHRALQAEDLARILRAVADKLTAPVPHVFIYKEDERLAYAVMMALGRNLLALPFLHDWVERLASAHEQIPWHRSAITPEGASARHNAKNFLRSLYFQLRFAESQPELSPQLLAKLAATLEAMEAAFYKSS